MGWLMAGAGPGISALASLWVCDKHWVYDSDSPVGCPVCHHEKGIAMNWKCDKHDQQQPCPYCQPEGFNNKVIIPDDVEWCIANGVYIKQMLIPTKNTRIEQHVHTFDHASMLAVGAVRVWQDDVFIGDFMAPMPIFIPAGKKHEFMSLMDATVIYCVHYAPDGKVEVADTAKASDNSAQD